MIQKIGIVANTAFNIYNFRLGLMKYLRQQGYEVVAIAPADDYVTGITSEGFAFIGIRNLARKGTNPLRDLLLANELRNIYSTEKLDAVLQYTIKPNIYGTLAARFTGTKTICTVTGLGYTFLNQSVAIEVARKLYKLAFRFADQVLFQNTYDRQVFVERNLVRADITAIVPGSGIDTKRFHPDFCTEVRSDNKTRFLMIARLLKDKGIYEYIDAARKVLSKNDQVEFHLAGEVDKDNPSSITREELQQWIDERIIVYHGYVADTRPLICQADCVVLPSYREGMPRVILEGMAMGKPCITTDAPGCKDAVDPSCGFLASVQNSESLAEKEFLFFDLNQTQRNEMGKAARLRAENIYEEDILFQYYHQILQKF
jgi:glycosyltransferase involved in cell wall biosynthesis